MRRGFSFCGPEQWGLYKEKPGKSNRTDPFTSSDVVVRSLSEVVVSVVVSIGSFDILLWWGTLLGDATATKKGSCYSIYNDVAIISNFSIV